MQSNSVRDAHVTEDVELRLARELVARGDDDAALAAYLALLGRDPTHFQCLTELGKLAFVSGFRSAARTAYEQAVAHHADEPMAHVNLANILAMSEEAVPAAHHYRAALALDPDFAPAHQGLALILADAGNHDQAAIHRARGFSGQNAIVHRPFRGVGEAPRVLLLVSAMGGNIPTDGWLTDRAYDVTAIHAEHFDPAAELPPHDLVFNAIGDADRCVDALAGAMAICARTQKQVLNNPAKVCATGRAATAGLLEGIGHVRTPCVRQLASGSIRTSVDIAFPILIRRPGYHTGQHFQRVDDRIGLVAVLDAFDRLGGGDLLLIDYMEARRSDGMARKYRVMFIDGALYPLHLAVSHDWKVHYFTSAMADDALFRAEEQQFLDDPAGVIGEAGMVALAEIAGRLGLDYAGIDFGLGPEGTILVFEANATMVLIPPSPDPVWDYRRPAISTAFEAVTAMLARRLAPSKSLARISATTA